MSDGKRLTAGDFWGGLAAMLVALPSAVAFGVTIYAPLGSSYAAQGALAGILGTTALGLVASTFGGTKRLITAPCAPATAVLSALAITLLAHGITPEKALVMMAMVALLCGLLEITFGAIGLGKLIKYMPYPVVSGYLSGVGIVIIVSQVPRFLGAKDLHFVDALRSPHAWRWEGMAVGVVTIAVMVLAPRVTKLVPAAILGLGCGLATYFLLALRDHSLLAREHNPLIVGQVNVSGSFLGNMAARWHALGALELNDVFLLITPALTLAVLLSIDTLKTCVVLDALTRSRHKSNRELIGQGLANVVSTGIGGIAGSGQMGATLINMSSGGQSQYSGMIEGALALLAFLALSKLVAWVPIAALAGILLVVGFRMIDRASFHLLKSRATVLDFAVIVVVVIVAEFVSLIAASGVGIGLAVLLFIREQVRGSVIHRRMLGNEMFSKQVRLPEEIKVLSERGDRTVIFDLQASLFFGTTDQLYTALEPDLKVRKYVILDMRRVQSVDFTAAHMLQQIEDMLLERGSFLIFSHLPHNVPSGQDMRRYLDHLGLVRPDRRALIFAERNEALEWVEDRILEDARLERALEAALNLREIELFKERKEETLAALESAMEPRSFPAGARIFARGERSDELFLIRKGLVRIVLPLDGARSHHLATFGRGDFFGEMSFLDAQPRSADAVAFTDTDVFVLSRQRFDTVAGEHKKLGMQVLEALARSLAVRLRHTNAELSVWQET